MAARCPAITLALTSAPFLPPQTHQLGAKGSGKTAFLQTLSSALLQSPPPTPGTIIAPTVELDRVNFAKSSVAGGDKEEEEFFFRRPVNVRVFDLWGTCLGLMACCFFPELLRPSAPIFPNHQPTARPPDTHTTTGTDGAALDSELPAILAGQAPIGFTAAHRVASLSPAEQTALQATRPQRMADAVLFFVAPSDAEDPARMEALKGVFEAAKAALGGHSPLVVLGRVDQVEGGAGKLLAEPLNWSNKKVKEQS